MHEITNGAFSNIKLGSFPNVIIADSINRIEDASRYETSALIARRVAGWGVLAYRSTAVETGAGGRGARHEQQDDGIGRG